MKIYASIYVLVALCFFSAVDALPKKLRGLIDNEKGNKKDEDHHPPRRHLEDGYYNDGDIISNDKEVIDEQEEDNNEEDVEGFFGEEFLKIDIANIAEDMGIGFDEAVRFLHQQREFSDLVGELNKDSAFSQAEMPMKPDEEFIVMFKKGEMSPESQRKMEEFMEKNENDIRIKLSETKVSLEEAEERGEFFASKLRSLGYGQIGYSIDGDQLEIMATLPESLPELADGGDQTTEGRVPPKEVAEIFGLDPDLEDMEDIVFIVEDMSAELEIDHHTYGGRRISGNGGQCTTGFSVYNAAGVTGITTAAHCTGMNWYDAVAPESDYSTFFQGQHNGGWGDVEWHTTGHWELPFYDAAPGLRWPVRGIEYSISKNEWVCGHSRMQGRRHCDRVFKTSVSQGSSNRLVAMRGMNMVGGDSGGPWSWYDKAYGIVKGARTICDPFWPFSCNWRDTWSRASYLGHALGVWVRTT